MGAAELVASLRRPCSVALEIGIAAIDEGIRVDARTVYRSLSAGSRLDRNATDRDREQGATAVPQRPVVVRHGERKTGTPEQFAGDHPAIDRPADEVIADSEFGSIDPVRGEVVADVVIGIAIVVGSQAERIDLTQQGVSIGEDTAV